MNYLWQGPLLAVGGLDFVAKQKPMTQAAQSDAKLNVLNTGPSVGFVEPIRLFECFASNRAAARPESGRFPAAALVNMMMEKIPVLRHHALVCWGIVVRSKDSGDIFVSDELFFHQTQRAGMNGYVAINKNNDIAGAGAG